jgi:hypothetical protein
VGVSLWNQGVRSGGCENLQRDEEEEICGGNLFTTFSAQDNLLLAKETRQDTKTPATSPHPNIYCGIPGEREARRIVRGGRGGWSRVRDV